jgi:large subunit ribosomal protein L1
MPFGTGKKVRIAVFAQGEKAEEAKKAGADIVGAEDLVKMIQDGNLDFDCCVATPDMMVKVGAVAKILGPKGLMPNPKLGTVTLNITDIINSIRQGQVNFRVEKAGIVHAPFGKADFELEALIGNLKSLVTAIVKSRPTGAKGNYVQAAFLSSTMGGSVKLDVADLLSLV